MRNISIQIRQSLEEIDEGINCFEALYDWLSQSPAGTEYDLKGLGDAIEIFTKIAQQLEREANDGF